MSTSSSLLSLEETIRNAGEGWLIDMFSPPNEAMNHIHNTLAAVREEATKRFGNNSPTLTEESLIQDYNQHSQQVRGFFQALGGTRTPEMLLMVWRIIQGMEVKTIQLNYSRKESFKLQVILETPSGEEDPPYQSNSINDFALLRHLGIIEINGLPSFNGFYALSVRGV